ncbi:MAG: hypothetical protein LPJ89_07375 [Hymenobacteraceae bacterium]|nr:hypothetical protein [Hymenobacteraceae bacterium]MDX5397388.1 hypothetical protein [Hymenobacteraceae bacterium]MDX5443586.1 hypothetical protein [Hymenobacteraceae bacterium]MDX5513466.1 hypothetical protein [Hymenobacteraceae bacterium]
MSKNSITFWLILIVSVVLSALAISFIFKIFKALVFIILLLILTPIFYALLKYVLYKFTHHTKDDELKKRY